jgi:hypothetical protein
VTVNAVVILALVVVVLLVVVLPAVRARQRRVRANASLARLAYLIDASVSGERLRGSYDGHSVEAWPHRGDPRPVAAPSTAQDTLRVDMFTLELGNVAGSQYWTCQRQPGLNPFGQPQLRFRHATLLGSGLERRLGELAGIAPPDAGLEERLRAAGVLDELARWTASSAWLPRARFSPSGEAAVERQLGRFGGAAGVSAELADTLRAAGRLQLTIEVPRAGVPPPEQFQALLDQSVRLATLNEQANPPAAHAPVVSPPASSGRSLAEAIVGSWRSELVSLTFAPDGTLSGGRPGRRQRSGRWSIAPDGRLHIGGMGTDTEAWIEDGQLTVILQGVAWKLERAAG